ncbi:hypothetical protein BU25DRAFT_354527, partial [Macroventuria anomochaeta]
SKLHIGFDRWTTTKGGKRGFVAVVAHYASKDGFTIDLPNALPQLVGAHTSQAIAETVAKFLPYFGINCSKLGYFVLGDALSTCLQTCKAPRNGAIKLFAYLPLPYAPVPNAPVPIHFTASFRISLVE